MRQPIFAEAFRFWLKLGFISFGGPMGQIALMHAEPVVQVHFYGNGECLMGSSEIRVTGIVRD